MKTLKITFLSLLIFTSTAVFAQTDPKDQNAADQARKHDTRAFDQYFARRATTAAIKDSVDAVTSTNLIPTAPKGSNILPDGTGKLYTSGLDLQQNGSPATEEPVISVPSNTAPDKDVSVKKR